MNMTEDAPAAPTTKDDPTIWRVDDALWAQIQPYLVTAKLRKKPGRPRHDDRPLFHGVSWIARRGGQWEALPRECGPPSTVQACCQEWVAHGCFQQIWVVLLAADGDEVGLDWLWQAADGCLVKAPLGNKGGPARRKGRAPPPPTGTSAAPSGSS